MRRQARDHYLLGVYLGSLSMGQWEKGRNKPLRGGGTMPVAPRASRTT